MLFEKEEEEEEEYLGETKKISLPRSEGGRDIAFHLGWNERLVEWDIKLDRERFRIIVYYPPPRIVSSLILGEEKKIYREGLNDSRWRKKKKEKTIYN